MLEVEEDELDDELDELELDDELGALDEVVDARVVDVEADVEEVDEEAAVDEVDPVVPGLAVVAVGGPGWSVPRVATKIRAAASKRITINNAPINQPRAWSPPSVGSGPSGTSVSPAVAPGSWGPCPAPAVPPAAVGPPGATPELASPPSPRSSGWVGSSAGELASELVGGSPSLNSCSPLTGPSVPG